MSTVPFRIFVFTSEDSNSVQVRQLASRLSRCRLCIFHCPVRKSKSLGEELGEAIKLSSLVARTRSSLPDFTFHVADPVSSILEQIVKAAEAAHRHSVSIYTARFPSSLRIQFGSRRKSSTAKTWISSPCS